MDADRRVRLDQILQQPRSRQEVGLVYGMVVQTKRLVMGKMVKLRKGKVVRDETGHPVLKRSSLWGVKYCPQCNCYWHPDINAARNIGVCYIDEGRGQPRRAHLQRP